MERQHLLVTYILSRLPIHSGTTRNPSLAQNPLRLQQESRLCLSQALLAKPH